MCGWDMSLYVLRQWALQAILVCIPVGQIRMQLIPIVFVTLSLSFGTNNFQKIVRLKFADESHFYNLARKKVFCFISLSFYI